jgi:hypothetical protein
VLSQPAQKVVQDPLSTSQHWELLNTLSRNGRLVGCSHADITARAAAFKRYQQS